VTQLAEIFDVSANSGAHYPSWWNAVWVRTIYNISSRKKILLVHRIRFIFTVSCFQNGRFL